jgi:hypothetical protein
VCHPGDDHDLFYIVDRVDDPIVAHSDSIIVPARELDRSGRSRIDAERIDGGRKALAERIVETSIRPRCLRMQADVVSPFAGYPRTSDQGTAASRSSRACSAARLSSRYSRRSMSSA